MEKSIQRFAFMKKTLAAMLLALLSGPGAAFAGEITVSAAQSLRNAFTDIARDFEKESGIKVSLNFAASGALLRQMENGAPVDVFASADQATMDLAESKGLVYPSSRRDFAGNDLVLITSNTGLVSQCADLVKADVTHIAIGKPETVPAGRYAKDALTTAGLYAELQPRFIFGDNVRQVLAYVERGEAEAGFVYRTDALKSRDVSIVAVMTGHKPVTYPISTTKDAGGDARRFVEYVLSPAGQKILAGYGFSSTK